MNAKIAWKMIFVREPEINGFLHFKCRNSTWPPKLNFDLKYRLQFKNFIEIALSHTVSEINVSLFFMHKFKMATKNGGKIIFERI